MTVFKNIRHQNDFDENGYVILPLLSEEVVQSLRKLHHDQFIPNDNPTWSLNAEAGAAKNDYIAHETKQLISPFLDKELTNYVNYGGTFFTKPKGYAELPLHQDTVMANSEVGFGCYTWMPLEDVTEENGCLFMVKKSHLFFKNLISFTYKNDVIARSSVPAESIRSLAMKAGEVLFFNGRLFHGSYENKSDSLRVAVNVPILGKDVPFVYYNKKNDTTAQEYYVTAESYRNSYKTYSTGLPPDGAIFSRDIPYRHTPVNSKLLIKSYYHHSGHTKPFFSKLKEMFV